jgi:molybdate transport system substrate-binding protein
MKKFISVFLLIGIFLFVLSGCSSEGKQDTKIMIAAAASLKNVFDEKLIPEFEKDNQNIIVEATYDSSGKLQQQIKEGAPVDVFISAATKQIDELNNEGYILEDSIKELLENKIVVIIPKDSNIEINNFEDLVKAEKIAIGDPASVPAGQYAKELLTSLNLWDRVQDKLSLGTNVSEVLNWVKEKSADVGIVYSTDAYSTDEVKIVLEADENMVSKVIYPVGIIKSSKNIVNAREFIEFLQSEKANEIFAEYGFTPIK